MNDVSRLAPSDEQEICVRCGFCCDGTLFHHANLNPGERGGLPENIEEACFSRDGNDFFRLPCAYFDGRCSIYDQKKADVCSDFRCQLLKDYAAGKLSSGEALLLVGQAVRMREDLIREFARFAGKKDGITFLKLLSELGKIRSAVPEGVTEDPAYGMLLARCNIFEALLIKYFWSAGEFEKLIMK